MNNVMDLNIENYDLHDILNLFKLESDFNEDDLRNAKKIVLKTHPDKSKLPPDYFRFYSKAYKTLYHIWEFKNKQGKKNAVEDYSIIETDTKKRIEEYKILSKEIEKDKKKFHAFFNEQFEKNKLANEYYDNGYGDWLKSNEDLDDSPMKSFHEMNLELEKKKNHLKQLVVHKDFDEVIYTGNQQVEGSNLINNAPESYGSNLFSSFGYEDLRKAYTETVVPVNNDDYNKIKKFKNINEYQIHRDSQEIKPLSEKQSLDYLNQKNKKMEEETTHRAFLLAKQLEEGKKATNQMWSSFLQLKNK